MSLQFLHFEVATDEGGSPVVLGKGAMGVTYRAFDTNLRCPVALKVIAPDLLADAIARTRFLREARTAASLRHPNVATVLFLGESGGEVFYAMEFVEGVTLQHEIKTGGPLDPARACDLALQVTKALAAAHRLGLVHRDIKPANIMLTHSDGEMSVKLIDFGLAKLTGGQFSGETLAAASAQGFQGTPHFASPEQINGEETDIRSDIYSFGVTLFAALTGRAPFEGTLAQVLSKHLSLAPPLEAVGPAGEPFRDILSRMLAKDPAERFQTPAELRAALESLAQKLQGSADDHRTAVPPAAGSVVGGRYRLDGQLAVLSHATIHRAERLDGGAPAGVVVLGVSGNDAQARWDDLVARLRPIPGDALLGVTKLEPTAAGLVLLTEWVDGVTLFEVMKRRRALPAAEAVAVLARVARGLDALVSAGVEPPPLALGDILLAPKAAADAALDQTENLRVAFLGAMPEDPSHHGPEATMTPGSGHPITRGSAQVLAGIAYEIFGGMRTDGAMRWTPLPALSAYGNSSLRSALEDASAFASADELVEALRPGAKAPRRQRRRAAPAPQETGGAFPTETRRPAPPPLPGHKPARRGLPVVPILAGGVLAALMLAGALAYFVFNRPAAPPSDIPSVTENQTGPVTAAATPATPTPTPAPTPDPAAEYIAAGEAAQARDDFGGALESFAEAARLSADPTVAKDRMQQIAANLDSEAFKMTPEKFSVLRAGLEAAAKQGVVAAQFLLGKELLATEPDTALMWIQEAAKRDHTEAAIQCGLLLAARGDWPQALTWLRIGANNGNARAMTFLAECLMEGKGTAPDQVEGVKILSEAAALYDPLAMGRLGLLLLKGIPGVLDQNIPEGFRLISQAASMGDTEATANLGVLYYNGTGTARNIPKAVSLWKKSAEDKDPLGMFFYAQALEGGLVGGAPNEPEARKWYAAAAARGNAAAIQKCQAKGIPIR